nr:hypothetical protein [Tanacetum cinerariifolium]
MREVISKVRLVDFKSCWSVIRENGILKLLEWNNALLKVISKVGLVDLIADNLKVKPAVVKENPNGVTSKVSKGKELDVLKYKRKIKQESNALDNPNECDKGPVLLHVIFKKSQEISTESQGIENTGESAKSTTLGALATGTGETAIVGGLKYSSNIAHRRVSAANVDILMLLMDFIGPQETMGLYVLIVGKRRFVLLIDVYAARFRIIITTVWEQRLVLLMVIKVVHVQGSLYCFLCPRKGLCCQCCPISDSTWISSRLITRSRTEQDNGKRSSAEDGEAWTWIFRGKNSSEKRIEGSRSLEDLWKNKHPCFIALTFHIISRLEIFGRFVFHLDISLIATLRKSLLRSVSVLVLLDSLELIKVEFVNSLANIWIGNHYVFVAVARYQRTKSVNQGSKVELVLSSCSNVNGVTSSKDTSNIHLVAKKVIELFDLELVSSDNSLELVLVKVFHYVLGARLHSRGLLHRLANSCFFELDHYDNMSIGRLCIATKHKQLIDEEVSVLINGENFIVHVRKLSKWIVKIEDDLESKDRISDNEQVKSHSGYEASTKHEMKNSNVMDEPDDVTDSEKEINETKEEEIPQKQNHFGCNSTPSDDSCPPGFKFLKGQSTLKPHGLESHKTSHCSTSFAKYRVKDFKGTSLLHEINPVIEVGGALGYDARGCRKTLKNVKRASVLPFNQ